MNLYGYEFQRESDLSHYGVIGMKWGVRKNPEKAYVKSFKKYKKLKEKAKKKLYNANKLNKKAYMHVSEFETYARRMARIERLKIKSARLNNKAEKWFQTCKKEFKDAPLSSVENGNFFDKINKK